jgi:uncharacterized protein (TIGR04255 family)
VLRTFCDELPKVEMLPKIKHQPKSVKEGQLPTEIEIHVEPQYLRARTESRSRIVQIGRNELLLNQIRSGDEPYPGFDAVLADFLDALGRYNEHIETDGVESAELHYVDLVVIPDLYKSGKEPRDYFVGAPEFPNQPFGNVASVSWSTVFSRPESIDVLQLAVQMLPPDEDEGRFRLDWHCLCPELRADDESPIAERLRSAHNYLLSCFQAVCKKPVWDLFEPA